jgi:NTE family protein
MKIALALGGGGAKGLAHVGVLEELSQAGIEPDLIVGTSVGALIGAVYLAGSLAALKEEIARIRLTDIPLLLSPSFSVTGFFSGKNVLELLGELIPQRNIEDLPKQFAAIATDLLRDQITVLDRGDIREAIRASISIPVLFTPFIKGQAVLVDGAVREPLPVATARALGADFVIAVDLFAQHPGPRLKRKPPAAAGLWPAGISTAIQHIKDRFSRSGEENSVSNIIEVVELTLSSTQRALTAAAKEHAPADFTITPQVGAVGLLDFHRGGPIVALGREAAQKRLPELLAELAARRTAAGEDSAS